MRIEGRFLQSRVARRFFLSVFLLAAVVLLSVGTLFYLLGDQLVRRAALAVLNESTRAVSRNMYDSLASASRLLSGVSAHDVAQAHDGVLPPHGNHKDVFSTVRVWQGDRAGHSTPAIPRLLIEPALQEDAPPRLSIVVPADGDRPALTGELDSNYFWERAQSGLYSLCVRVDPGYRPYCQYGADETAGAVSVEREVLFRPFFDAAPWKMKATASAELTRLLPVSLGLIAAGVSALAFLAAVIASSIYLRRWAGSLERLMHVTQKAGAGNFSDRVPVESLKDELRDLGSSFNTMMGNLQVTFDFNAVLSRMDRAVLEREPVERVVQIVLAYAGTLSANARPQLVCRVRNTRRIYQLDDSGSLTVVEDVFAATAPAQPGLSVDVGEMLGGPATLVLRQVGAESMPREASLTSRLEDLGRRLAIAAEAAQHEAKLTAQANTDSLTGLLNRHGFLASLEALIQTPKWGGRFDVAFVDLDGFKEINDAFGHFVGDEILRQFSRRLLAQVQRTFHHVARLGGDEFALLLPVDMVVPFSHHLRKALREPFLIDGREIMLAFSMGVASYPTDGTTVGDLLRQSDLAMFKAKGMGGSALVHFTPEMDAATTERLSLLQELRNALSTEALHVVYQPRVSTSSQRIVSAEALMRWQHPVLGWISPARFIPLAEESGLIVPFGYWILEETCKQYKAWQASGTGLQQVSVNVSPIQMMAPGFFDNAAQILRRHDIAAGCIELEITEGAMVQNIEETSVRIRELQLAGFHVALDDFGVGYSSLSYLHQIPFDTLKVDQSFVKRLHESQVSFAIATAIVTLAKALGKRIVAEGVELAEHATALTDLGADELQGYFFGRPMEADAVAEMARAAIRASGDTE